MGMPVELVQVFKKKKQRKILVCGFFKVLYNKGIKIRNMKYFSLANIGIDAGEDGDEVHTHTLCCAQGAALREKGNSYLYKVVKIPTYIEQ